MQERLHLQSPNNASIAVIKIDTEEQIEHTTEPLSKISGRLVYSNKERPVSLIIKEVGITPGDPLNAVDTYLNIWQQMKQARIPVVPTVRKVSNNTVAMTDLTADGSVIYDKYALFQAFNDRRIPTNLDPLFKDINLR